MPVTKPGNELELVAIEEVLLTMSDGTRLAAQVEFPAKDGKVDFTKKYPVILSRSAYRDTPGWDRMSYVAEYGAASGFVHVCVAARGTYNSEGTLEPLANEGWGQEGCPDRHGYGAHTDGIETINWVKRQPWCNGTVVTYGMSWQGASQLLPWLTDNQCGLETSVVFNPAMNSGFGNWGYEDGFFTLELQIQWALALVHDQVLTNRYAPRVVKEFHKDNELLGMPLSEDLRYQFDAANWANNFAYKYGLKDFPVLRQVPFFKKWVENRDNLDFFSYNDTTGRKHAFNKPLLFMGGFYDVFGRNTIWAYENAVKDAPTREIADGHRLMLYPFNHASSPLEYLGDKINMDGANVTVDWFNRQVYGTPAEMFDKGKVILYTIGENKWRAEQAWPLADTQYTEYYLHSGGNAVLGGDGLLSTEKPAAEPADHYTYDPADPAPTLTDHRVLMGGYADNTPIEQRSDVLVFTSPELEEDVEITGWIKATLYAATSGTDTDFIVRLSDVLPDGRSMHLSFGGVRGRYRKDRRNPEAMVPGQVEKLDVAMHANSCIFKKGHRIRVSIASAAFPMYDLNPNQFIDLNTCTEKDFIAAEQTICHDAEHPSSITLPIIPASHKRDWFEFEYTTDKTGGMREMDWIGGASFLKTAEMDASELPTVE